MPCFLSFFPPRVRTRTETPSDSTGPASASASAQGLVQRKPLERASTEVLQRPTHVMITYSKIEIRCFCLGPRTRARFRFRFRYAFSKRNGQQKTKKNYRKGTVSGPASPSQCSNRSGGLLYHYYHYYSYY